MHGFIFVAFVSLSLFIAAYFSDEEKDIKGVFLRAFFVEFIFSWAFIVFLRQLDIGMVSNLELDLFGVGVMFFFVILCSVCVGGKAVFPHVG